MRFLGRPRARLPYRLYRFTRLVTGPTAVRLMSAPASSSRMSDVGAPPPCVSLPAVVVGGMLGPPVTPLT